MEAGLAGPEGAPKSGHRRVMALVEVALVAIAVAADVIVPTLVILALTWASLLARREHWSSLGFRRPARPWAMATRVLGLVVAWTALQVAVFMPVIEHVTGRRQDMEMFEDLQGDLGLLVALLALTWTIAAVGEEAAYRGYALTRATDAFGRGRAGLLAGVLVTSALFGLAHTEQGAVGVALTFLDALFFSALRYRYATVWAAVVAHGASNTIGLTAVYLTGPIYGLW